MSILDIILIGSLLVFLTVGFMVGLVHSVGAFLGLALGMSVATAYYAPVASWIIRWLPTHELFVKMISYILIVVVVSRCIGLLFHLVEKVIQWVPLAGALNRVAGACLAVGEGVLLMGVSLTLVARFPYISPVTKQLASSQVAPWMMRSSTILTGFFPQEFTQLEPLDLDLLNRILTENTKRFEEYKTLSGSYGAEKLQQLRHLVP